VGLKHQGKGFNYCLRKNFIARPKGRFSGGYFKDNNRLFGKFYGSWGHRDKQLVEQLNEAAKDLK
jgi:hypothetical protein